MNKARRTMKYINSKRVKDINDKNKLLTNE